MTRPAAGMRIVAARDLVPAAPDGLSALRVLERAARGATKQICLAGDVGLCGHVASRPDQDPFGEVAPVLRAADLSFANLESPLLDEVPPDAHFAAPVGAAPLLSRAGFGVLSLANNHMLDHGARGLATTREAVAAAGIETVGAGPDPAAARRLAVFELGGLRLGWLACARTLQTQEPGYGFWEYDPGELAAAIRKARGEVDALAVSIHIGYMFVDYPHPGHRREALGFLDAGADLIVMHHAHVVQGIERAEGGGLVCYNLGNLLFDWTAGEVVFERMLEEQRSGGILVCELDRRGVSRAAFLPVRVDDDWNLRWARGRQGRAVLERLARLSAGWDTRAARIFHRQLSDRATRLAVRDVFLSLRRDGLGTIPGLVRRVKGHHLRMLAGWPAQRLKRWLCRPT